MLRPHARRRLTQHRDYLGQHEPTLHQVLDEETATAHIAGSIEVALGAGRHSPFSVLIRYASTPKGLNPYLTPETYDPVERFPREADRHIEADGRFCMWLPHTDYRDFDQPDGLARHLDRVRQFIRLQLTYEDRLKRDITPHWPGLQWGHGDEGYREWVRQHTEGLAQVQVVRFALALDSPPLPRSPCPCGSRRKFGGCHRSWFESLRAAARHRKSVILQELHQIVTAQDAENSLPTSTANAHPADAHPAGPG